MFYKTKKTKKLVSWILLFMMCAQILVPIGVNAQQVVSDPPGLAAKIYGNVKDAAKWVWEKWETAEEKIGDHWAAVGFKAALHNFLRNLAIESATYVASGDKGQKPMIYTSNWEEYMLDAADEAAGTFLMAAADQWDSTGAEDRADEDYWNCQENAFDECYDWCEGLTCEEECFDSDNPECETECENERYDCREECQASYECEEQYQDNLDNIKGSSPTAGSAGSSYSDGTAGSILKFLCEPDFNVKLNLTASLAEIQRPKRPKCTYSSAARNWEEFVEDPDFLTRFQPYWNPEENDIGIALTMHSSFLQGIADSGDLAEKARKEGGGWKAVTDFADNILTPGNIIYEMGAKPIKEGTKYEEVFTGDIIADSIATFANTLMSKLINKWVMEGMAKLSGEESSDYNWADTDSAASSAAAANVSKGTQAAKAKYLEIFQPDYKSGGAYSILSKLLMCPDIENAGPTECVITQPFADAVQQELTVQEAIDQGYISIDFSFGFNADGLEPSYNEGYPYRSLIILRKYRIIPVGWELAARYIGDFISNSSNSRIYNIQEIIDVFNDSSSPFYQLIDPNWVLKAPEVFCGIQGIGEKIISKEVSEGIDVDNDGDYDDKDDKEPSLNIMRDDYCADEQSCLKEDEKGNCLFYGYCTEEKRIWDFQGNECDPYYNTCQSFASPQGNEVFYLKNTADYSGCNEDNAGCKWYCSSRNAGDDGWACLGEGWDLNLDNYCANTDGCEITDSQDIDQDGDTAESCVVPYKGIECVLDGSKARLTINKDLVPNVNNDIYLNQKAESCSSSSEGCREYIRTKPNLGTNLITNSSFKDILETNIVDDGIADIFTSWSAISGEASSASFTGNTAFRSLNSATANLTKVIDTGYSLGGREFIFSFYAQNCVGANFQFYIPAVSGSQVELISGNNDDWERFNVAYNFPSDGTIDAFNTELTISISGAAGGIPLGCLIDSVQLEEVSSDGYMFSYEDYHQSNLLYLNKAPDYYHCELYTVYEDDFDNQENCEIMGHFWRTDIERCVEGGSEQCADFALECMQDDVGCDLYEPVDGDPSIPGVVRSDDFCPESCNGYDSYKQEATFFESEKFPEFLIPNNEERCSAQDAGCSEFTNLDKLKDGGEAVEYYSYLRPCHEIGGDCATFYTWIGSEETGFQLVAHLLLDADNNGIPDNIYNTADAADIFGDCNNYDDAISNPECNEFYSESNIISYWHYKNTVTCSDSCHPYRKTKSSQADCVIHSTGSWDWGEWSANSECIYEALPEQGIVCPSSQNDCYEYKGNTSNNVRKVIDDGFEQAVNNWGVGALSSESLIRGGHSLKVNLGNEMNYSLKAHCDLGFICALGEGCECSINNETVCYAQNTEQTCLYKSLLGYQKTYFLSFWAKGGGSLTAKFSSAPAGEEFAIGSVILGPEWQEYSFGPVLVDWDMDNDDPASAAGDNILETLKISGFSETSYIDNIILKEEQDNLFLIRPEFWNVSSVCDQDHNGDSALQYMLGCEEYKSEVDKQIVYLKSFNRLCSEDAVGCEALIDTFNSHSYLEEIFNSGDTSEITVFADEVDTLVNDKQKTCKSENKGCMALGIAEYRYNMHNTTEDLADDTDDLYQYKTAYYLNNPDKYSDTLCFFDNVGCGKFSSSVMGDYYFKDPVSQRINGDAKICEYKLVGGESAPGWYLANTTSGLPNCPLEYSDIGIEYAAKSCIGGGGSICSDDFDCPGGYCANWTAVCPSEIDGCAEYIDPLSVISKNVVFNSDFAQDVDVDGIPDGWQLSGGDYIISSPIYLQRDTVYTVLSNSNGAGSAVVLENCVNDISGSPINLTSYDDSMVVSTPASARIISNANNRQFSGRFYTGKDSSINCRLRVSGNLVPSKFVKIFKTGIYYNIDSSIDKVSCNGMVNYEEGCVLFNKREISIGLAMEDIIYDADRNNEDINTPQSCLSGGSPDGTCDSNLLVKVKPTRTCGEWLYCKSKVRHEEADRCAGIGLCNSFDDKGICDGFVVEEQKNQVAGSTISLSDIRDKSGYVNIGNNWAIGMIDGYYPFGMMEQKGQLTTVPNGNFEYSGSNGYPIGWNVVDESWDENKFKVINNPVEAEAEGIDYPLEGRSFLRFSPSASQAASEFIDVEPNTEYILSAYINTMNFNSSTEFDGIAAIIGIVTYDIDGNGSKSSVYPGSNCDISECEDQDQAWYNGCGILSKSGYDWTRKSKKFRVGSNTSKIKLFIAGHIWYGGGGCCDLDNDGNCPEEAEGEYISHASAKCDSRGEVTMDFGCPPGLGVFTTTIKDDSCAGNVYIDDIKLRPALEVNDSLNEVQTCRSYPEYDSLSCDYYEDSGTRQKGLFGYCLEYDRYPGNEDACLMWWPVDNIQGEGIEEGAGYADRFPLYYCIDLNIEPLEIYRDISHLERPWESDCNKEEHFFSIDDFEINDIVENRPFALYENNIKSIQISFTSPYGGGYTTINLSSPDWHSGSTSIPDRCGDSDYASYTAKFDNNGIFEGMDYVECDGGDFCNDGGSRGDQGSTNFYEFIISTVDYTASKIAQVVTPVGQNKYWSGRVYQGSDYGFSCNNGIINANTTCSYLSDYQPFGSIVPGAETWYEMSNPYEWDSKDDDGIQPLYYELPDESLSEPYQPRMGQLHDREEVKRLFAKSYGVWEWQEGEMCADDNFVQGETGMVAAGECQQYCEDGYCQDVTVVPDNVPTNMAAITASCYLNNIAWFLDDQKWYAFDETQPVGSQWTSGLLSDAWDVSTDPDIPNPPYSAITAAYYWNNLLWFLDDQKWYVYDETQPVGSQWTSGLLSDVWGVSIDPDVPSPPYSDITSAFCGNTAGNNILVFLDDQKWYAYDDTQPAGSELEWTSGLLADFLGYTTSQECVGGANNGNLCDPTINNDCPGSHCIESGRYVPISGEDWSVPDTVCVPASERPDAAPDDYCAIPPDIDNIKINNSTGNITIAGNGFINLTFNSIVDSQQLPLVMYAVDWGDNEDTVVSGVEMRDRPNADNPHSLYHLYSYWDLKAKETSGVYGNDHWIICSSGECSVQPRVKIKDNWGWCNNGVDYDFCPTGGYEALGGWIVVTEK